MGVSEVGRGVYSALFADGASTITELSRKTKEYRPRIYAAIGELTKRGFVSKAIKGKRNVYVAAPPAVLRNSAQETLLSIERDLPELECAYSGDVRRPSITLYEGREGVASVFADLVDSEKKGGTFYRYSSERDLERTNTYLPRDYRKKRDAKGLERFVITAPRIGKGKRARMERAMKYIPPGFDLFDQDVIELIYADKVAFIDLNTETSFIVASANLADFHKKLFRLLYQKL